MNPTEVKEGVSDLFRKAYAQRKFSVDSVKEFAYSLKDEKAFAFSRIAPKELLEEVIKGQRGSIFCDHILNFNDTLDPDREKRAKQIADVEVLFLASHGHHLTGFIGEK